MIRLEHVYKRYGELTAVEDLSFEVAAGELVVLIGPSGCGKTTTLKMINRLIEPSAGKVFVNNQDTALQDPQKLRRGIGYVIQSIGLFPHLTVQQNIQVVPDLLGWPKRKSAARADELLELVGLEPERYRHSYPHELSGGQQQRVGVARALAVDPPVLLMDEPFGAVDPITRERLQDEFLRLQQRLKKTIVMVTHDIDEAIKLADRICLMHAGRIEQYDTPEMLLRAPKNRFVRQFVGSDRALKRLVRVRVAEVMAPAAAIERSSNLAEALSALGERPSLYVTEAGRLVGWVNRADLRAAESVEAAYTPITELATHALTPDDDVKEALARMLALGVATVPVVDGSGRLLGQLELAQIVALTAPEPAPAADETEAKG